MHNFDHWLRIPALVLPAVISAPAFATQYLNVEQAQKILFPNAEQFLAAPLTLNAEQIRAIETRSGVRVRNSTVNAWRAQQAGKPAGWFLLDEVYGKHELITYAVALTPDGTVHGIEILDYRETHGNAIRNPKWRAQFAGKKAGAPLQLDDDIKNISGATLSCKHVTEGVRRLLASYAVALK